MTPQAANLPTNHGCVHLRAQEGPSGCERRTVRSAMRTGVYHAAASLIGTDVIRETSELVSQRLDENFFRVRFDRLTPREKTYLRAMAELGEGPYRTGDIAFKLGGKTTSLAPVRANLIKKGMVYSPSHGEMAFTVPLFDMSMRRAMPRFEP